MDHRQRELLNSPDLAAAINFTNLIKCERLERLVSKNKINEIRHKYDGDHSRNVMLLGAIQESELHNAFDEFIEILILTKNEQALKLISTHSSRDKRCSPNRGIFSLFEKFVSNRPKHQHNKYPLGMNSGDISKSSSVSMATQSTGYCDGDVLLSPYKEKHQATVIGSGGRSDFHLDNNHTSTPGQAHQRPRLQGLSPSTSLSSTEANNDGYQIRSKQKFNTQSSQTPIKPQELALLAHNMSLTDTTSPDIEDRESVVFWQPYAHASSTSHLESHRSASPCAHLCHPSYASSESDSSSDSLIIDSKLILDASITMAIAKEGAANTMSVKKATTCHDDEEEDYKMTSDPRGPCLIVNNIDFEAEIFPTRKGSDEDARRFDSIFRQLGFSVIMRRNQTADKMRQLFKEVAATCRPEHDALFVFILSHGSEHGIYGTDGLEICLESEIISCFDNRNCKAMIGKPKVFVIQACRGRTRDCGSGGSEGGDMTDSIAWPSVLTSPTVRSASQENRVPSSWLPSAGPSEGKKRKHPIRTDMLLVFSCLAGFVSVRNELAGSWLGVALAYFIMTHAHERDFLRILNLVASDVIQRESSHGHIQSIEIRQLGWTKNLYFNPGIYKDSNIR